MGRPPGWTADNAAAVFDADEREILFASGRRVSRWNLATGALAAAWDVPLGLDDALAVRPGKPPLLVRREDVRIRGKDPVVRARELGPKGAMTELYAIRVADGKGIMVSADGRTLLINSARGVPRGRLFDAPTGKPLPLDLPACLDPGGCWLSPSGRVLVGRQTVGDRVDTVIIGLTTGQRHGPHPRPVHRTDDLARLGVISNLADPLDNGVSVYRVGETRPLVTFDVRRPPRHNSCGLSGDGRLVFWGRADGTVCVGDVSRCLEQIAEFTR